MNNISKILQFFSTAAGCAHIVDLYSQNSLKQTVGKARLQNTSWIFVCGSDYHLARILLKALNQLHSNIPIFFKKQRWRQSLDHSWNWAKRKEYDIPIQLGKLWAAWVSIYTNSHHLKSLAACLPKYSLHEKSSRTCESTSSHLEVTHSYRGKCVLQNITFQMHGLTWWDPRWSHHPRLGKALDFQWCQTATKTLTKHTKGGCDRSSAALLAHQNSPRVGLALHQTLEELLSEQEKACNYRTGTDMVFKDLWWQALSRAGGKSPGRHKATPPHRCVLHSQLWGSNGHIMSCALSTVANVLLMASRDLNLPQLHSKTCQVLQLLKIIFRLSHN